MSRALCAPGQHTAKRRIKCTRQSRSLHGGGHPENLPLVAHLEGLLAMSTFPESDSTGQHGHSRSFRLGGSAPKPLIMGQYFALYSLNCTKFGKLIIGKNIKSVATRCHILKLKCTKFDFSWSSAPDPAGGSLSHSPRPLSWI